MRSKITTRLCRYIVQMTPPTLSDYYCYDTHELQDKKEEEKGEIRIIFSVVFFLLCLSLSASMVKKLNVYGRD